MYQDKIVPRKQPVMGCPDCGVLIRGLAERGEQIHFGDEELTTEIDPGGIFVCLFHGLHRDISFAEQELKERQGKVESLSCYLKGLKKKLSSLDHLLMKEPKQNLFMEL